PLLTKGWAPFCGLPLPPPPADCPAAGVVAAAATTGLAAAPGLAAAAGLATAEGGGGLGGAMGGWDGTSTGRTRMIARITRATGDSKIKMSLVRIAAQLPGGWGSSSVPGPWRPAAGWPAAGWRRGHAPREGSGHG